MFKVRLKELRETKGFRSQQSFADALGVAQSTVGGWEAGKREPNFETTRRIADFFGCSVDYLLGRTDNSPPADTPAELTPDEEKLLRCYRALSTNGKEVVYFTARLRQAEEEQPVTINAAAFGGESFTKQITRKELEEINARQKKDPKDNWK